MLSLQTGSFTLQQHLLQELKPTWISRLAMDLKVPFYGNQQLL